MFDLTFLGTAASTPAVERGLPALLVASGAGRFLVDCGEGTQRQILRAGVGFRRLRHVLLTHNHLDHVLGLGGLIATLALLKLRDGLRVCGSAETVGFAQNYIDAIWGQGPPIPLHWVTLSPGDVIPGDAITARGLAVRCFAVRHRGTQSLGYRFAAPPRCHLDAAKLAELGVPSGPIRSRLAAGETVTLADGRRIAADEVLGPEMPGSSVAVIGDAEEVDSLIEPVRGADALVIEATFLEADAGLAAERGHLTAAQAGRLAAAAGVGALYLTHLSGRYDPSAVAAEAARHFPAAKACADFDRITV